MCAFDFLPRPGRGTLRSLRVAAIAVLLAGCSGGFHSTEITGATFGHDFQLTDQNGQTRRLADFKGKVVSVFFGYTQCPDVCPTTLGELKQVRENLGPDAGRLQVLFITVDPERDTPALLKTYLGAFDPSFLGLTGTAVQVAAVARDYKVFYEKVPGDQPGEYSFNHTAGTYVFDPQGRIRLFVREGEDPKALTADVRQLLAGK